MWTSRPTCDHDVVPGDSTQMAGTWSDGDDVVDSGPDRDPRRRRIAAALAVLLVVVSATVWQLDSRRRTAEFGALRGCVTTAEAAWADADARVTGMSSYVRPSIGAGLLREMELGLYRLVAAQAATGEPAVRGALRRCQAVSVLSFHPALRAARTAFLACLRAEVDLLVATASDGSRAFANSDRLTRLRSRALARLVLAAPDDRSRRVAERLMPR